MRLVGFCFISSLIAFSAPAIAQEDSLEARIVLVGDGGALVNGRHPVMSAIKQNVPLNKKTFVVFLGDNIYKEGLPDDQLVTYAQAKAVLDSQANLIEGTDARALFIPGNHDWNNGGVHGYDNVRNEQRYIDMLARENVLFYPKDGCPGPVAVVVSDNTVVITVDSQWWLHPYDKPGIQSDCPNKTQDQVLSELEDLLNKYNDKFVIFATHHPFKSLGIHGGYFTIKQHIFPFTDANRNMWIPLPLIGSIYPITRGIFGTVQDLPHPVYRDMVNKMSEVVKKHPNVLFAAGHEHTLQWIKDSAYNYIVSGSACKQTRVSKNKNTVFASDNLGYAVLDIVKNKNVYTSFYVVSSEDGATTKVHEGFMLNFTKPIPKVLETGDSATIVTIDYKNSAEAIANVNYDKVSGLKRKLLGNNYRKEWATPVTARKFNLKQEKGGFKIVSLGGGKQTKTLRLKDKKGREWILRTITKDPTEVVPRNFRNSVAEDLVQDFTSATHPYAPLTVPPLSKAIGIRQAEPELVFVPDDPAFGIYRKVFANKLCFLEERHAGLEDSKSTAKTLEKLIEDNDHRVDQRTALRARLLDIVLGDFDRHFDQWRFEVADTGKGKLYVPIPRDRDQAYFYSDGFLLNMITKTTLKFLKGFRHDIPSVEWFGFSAKDFDRIFLNKLSREDWEKEIKLVQEALSDEVIERSIRRLPPTVFNVSGETLINKLKSRRNLLMKEGIRYYEFISKEVNILGSNKKELFKITGQDNKMRVQVYKRNKQSDSASLMYDRVFDKTTDEVRLYGMNDDDIFEVENSTPRLVKIRIIGGRGKDTFNIDGRAKSYVYDLATGDNHLEGKARVKDILSPDPFVNVTDITNFRYNYLKFPIPRLGFNAEDGLLLGIGLEYVKHGFRKSPYAAKHKFGSLVAVNRNSYQLKYQGEFNQLLGKWDLVLNGTIVNPVLDNFFGLGNETEQIFDNKRMNREFYRVRYNFVSGDVLLRKRPNRVLEYTLGASVYNYWNHPEDNRGKILQWPEMVKLDATRIFQTKTYAGLKAGLLIDNLENTLFPARGISWNTEFTSMQGLNSNSLSVTKVVTDMNVYAAMNEPSRFVTVLRVGGGHIFSKNFDYFQALSLGQNNYLRGFRKNRFAGSGLLYGSLEFRLKLFESKSPLFPGGVGLVAFNDLGRVWLRGEDSRTWHHSYGGGIYYAPFNIILISATAAFSKEETLFNLTVGTRFNLTF